MSVVDARGTTTDLPYLRYPIHPSIYLSIYLGIYTYRTV